MGRAYAVDCDFAPSVLLGPVRRYVDRLPSERKGMPMRRVFMAMASVVVVIVVAVGLGVVGVFDSTDEDALREEGEDACWAYDSYSDPWENCVEDYVRDNG